MRVLLIEDEKITRISLSNTLYKNGYDIGSSGDGNEGYLMFKQNKFDIVITDLTLPNMNGMDILRKIKEEFSECIVIIITAFATVETAVEALKLGAYDYLMKPFSPEKLLSMLDHIRQLKKIIEENNSLKKRLQIFEDSPIVGRSEPMRKLLEKIKVIAENDFSILIEGESGTGKELVARTLHQNSTRKDFPFIPINCAVIPESLLESELFGHEKGAFTGAIKQHQGYFERADHGTLFIDDIDDFPMPLQVKLLRVLQEKKFQRVGGTGEVNVDVRIISATKIDLKKKTSSNLFREDLFYRLNILPLKIPPLRERKEDIPLLIEHFFEKHNAREKISLLNKNVLNIITQYIWPGNVRELENIVERIIVLSEMDKIENIISEILTDIPIEPPRNQETPPEKDFPPFEEYINQKEREIISWAMNKANNNITQAAKLLDLPRSTLSSKLTLAHQSGRLNQFGENK